MNLCKCGRKLTPYSFIQENILVCTGCGLQPINCHCGNLETIKENVLEQTKLPEIFIVPGPKTLKVEAAKGTTIEEAAGKAYTYLWTQEQYNRIEVRVGKTYLVLAKLRDN